MTDRKATVRVMSDRIEVVCRFNVTHVSLDLDTDVRTQISSAVFAHQRMCGQCDTDEAYRRASTEYLDRSMREKTEEPPA